MGTFHRAFGDAHGVRTDHRAVTAIRSSATRFTAPATNRAGAPFPTPGPPRTTLGFRHPLTDQDIMVEAPVPRDMDALIVDLRNRYGIRGAGGEVRGSPSSKAN